MNWSDFIFGIFVGFAVCLMLCCIAIGLWGERDEQLQQSYRSGFRDALASVPPPARVMSLAPRKAPQ